MTWVSRRWRFIALECPTLWTAIVNSGWWQTGTWLPTFLERSGEAPLEVKFDDRDVNFQAALEPLRPLTHRIRRLQLRVTDGTLCSILVAKLSGRFDLLEEADLSGHYDEPPSDELNPAKDGLHISPDRFPVLRSFALNRVNLAWESSSFVNLNVLRLFVVPHGPSVAAILRLMRDSPQLRILKLSDTSFPLLMLLAVIPTSSIHRHVDIVDGRTFFACLSTLPSSRNQRIESPATATTRTHRQRGI